MLVDALAARQVVGGLDGVQAVDRDRGVDPCHVLGGVAHVGLAEAAHGDDRPARREHVLRVQVPVHHHRTEPPQGGVLQGGLPPRQQGRRHLPRRRGVIHQAQPAVADLLGVVDRHARLGDHGGGQLVQFAERPAHPRRQAGARVQGGDVHGAPLQVGANLDVRSVGAQSAGHARHVEGQAAVVDDPTDTAQHVRLGVQARADRVVVGLEDLPVTAPGVDDADRAQTDGLLLRQCQTRRVQAGHGDTGQGRQGQRRTFIPPRPARGRGGRGTGSILRARRCGGVGWSGGRLRHGSTVGERRVAGALARPNRCD